VSFNRVAFNTLRTQSVGLLPSAGKGLVRAFQRASVSLNRQSLSSIYFNGRYFHPCRRCRRRRNWRLRAKVNTERFRSLFSSLSLFLSFTFHPLLPPRHPSSFHHLFTVSKTKCNSIIPRWGIRIFRILIKMKLRKDFIHIISEVNEII